MKYSYKRIFNVLNFSLILICLVLTISLFDVPLPNLGLALEGPIGPMECHVTWDETTNVWNDIDRCCLEAKKQLKCTKEQNEWVCKTGPGAIEISLSNSAFDYCKDTNFWK